MKSIKDLLPRDEDLNCFAGPIVLTLLNNSHLCRKIVNGTHSKY
jgi:hypothetical protein